MVFWLFVCVKTCFVRVMCLNGDGIPPVLCCKTKASILKFSVGYRYNVAWAIIKTMKANTAIQLWLICQIKRKVRDDAMSPSTTWWQYHQFHLISAAKFGHIIIQNEENWRPKSSLNHYHPSTKLLLDETIALKSAAHLMILSYITQQHIISPPTISSGNLRLHRSAQL